MAIGVDGGDPPAEVERIAMRAELERQVGTHAARLVVYTGRLSREKLVDRLPAVVAAADRDAPAGSGVARDVCHACIHCSRRRDRPTRW